MKNNMVEEVVKHLENGTMKLSFVHQGHYQSIFMGEDVEAKIDLFKEIFSTDIIFAKHMDLDDLKSSVAECSECGEYYVFIYKNGEMKEMKIVVGANDITYEEASCKNLLAHEFEVEFPSGVLIYDDRLPYSYDMLINLCRDNKASLNSKAGCVNVTDKQALKNILHVYSGDTSPALYKAGNTLVINPIIDNENSPCHCGEVNCECDYAEYTPIEDGVKMGETITDLHWVSLVDLEVYKELLIKFYGPTQANEYIAKLEPLSMTVTPGKYKCTYYGQENIICKLELI